MGLDAKQFYQYVQVPALRAMPTGWDTIEAQGLVLGSILAESGGLRYLYQVPNGPARGLGQMEPFTYHSLWADYLAYKEYLIERILTFLTGIGENEGLHATDIWNSTPREMGEHFFPRFMWDLGYQVIMTRVKYRSIPAPLPLLNAEEMWEYYKKYYNTAKGKARRDLRPFQQAIDIVRG